MVQMSGRGTRSKPEQQSPIEFPTIVSCSTILEPLSCYISTTTNPTTTTPSTNLTWPWQCNVCPEKYSEYDQLKIHMMEHSIEMPFECRLCSSRFETDRDLAKHIQVRHINSHGNTKIENITTTNNPIENLDNNSIEKPTKVKKRRPKLTEKSGDVPGAISSVHRPLKPKIKPKNNTVSKLILSSEIKHCFRCKIDFHSYEDWRQHAVYNHAFIKNPCPIVEMNYVDVQTIMKATQPSIITTIRKTGEGEVNEKIRLIFCRDKGNYVLKKSISTDEPDIPNKLVEAATTNGVLDNVIESEENEVNLNGGTHSPENSILNNRLTIKDESPIRNHQPKYENEPETESEAVSPSINKENMPSEIELPYVDGDKRYQGQKSVHEVSANGTKSPTSGTYIFLGNSSSESERALANAGNSNVVIIQNDILHIGADADAADLQRLTSATTTNTSVSLSSITNTKPKNFIRDTFPTSKKDKIIDNSSECILPNFLEEIEHTVMISEEIRNRSIPSSQIVNLALTSSLNGTRTSTHEGNNNEIHSVSMSIDEAGGVDPALFPSITTNSAEVPRMSPAQTNNESTTRYENISPPIDDDNTDVDDSDNGLHIHLPEETEMTEVHDESERPHSTTNNSPQVPDKHEDNHEIKTNSKSQTQIGTQRSNDDDFRCQVCQELFTSADELDTHFSESHFRVGTGSNILEPESPFPAPTVLISEVQTVFPRRSLDEHSSEAFQQRQQRPPDMSSALARQLMHDHRQQPPMTTTETHFSSRPLNAHIQMRPGMPPHLQSQNHSGRPMSNGPHLPMNSSTVHHMVSTSNASRPPLSSAPPNYTITQSLNSRPLNNVMTHASSRPQLTISQPPSNAQQQHQQQLRMNQQNQVIAQAHAHAQALHQHYQANSTSLQNAMNNNSRPMPLSGIRHNSMERDGPRIVEVTSMGRQGIGSQQLQYQQHLMLSHQQQMQLRHPGLQSRQAHDQQEMQHQFRISNVRGGMNLHAIRQEGTQKRNGSPLSSLVDNSTATISKQPRIEGHGIHHSNEYNRPSNLPNSSLSDLTITQRISPQTQSQSSPTIGLQLPLDRNVVNAIGSVNTGGVNSVRLGNAITLSVCPTSDPLSLSQPTSSSPGSRNASVNSGPIAINTNSVASALAVRGVTVTPASPPVSAQESANQRYPVNVSISPNPDLTSRTSPISVIQRVERTHTTVSPTGTYFPPAGIHQFAVPRAPAPRGPPQAVISSITDRPDRPPTVDLTDDDSILSMTSTPSRQSSLHIGRPTTDRRPIPSVGLSPLSQQQPQANRPSRPAVACNLCGVLFASPQSLEEHKFSRHGIPQQRGVTPSNLQIRNVNPGIRPPPPQLQQMRPVSPGNRPSNPSGNSRYLYIPLLDLSRLDPSRLRRLEEIGITSIVPLHGNERAAGQMGIPVVSLRSDGLSQHMPWDSVLPVGPIQMAAQAAANPNLAHRSQENGNS